MKILFVQGTSHRKGHYADYVSHICQEIGRLGHEVLLCTDRITLDKHIYETPTFAVHEVGNGKYDFLHVEKNKGRIPLYYEYGWFRNSYVVLREALRLASRKQYDVLHITGIEFLTASLLLRRYSSFLPPTLMEVYAANWTAYPGSAVRRWYKSFQREIFRKTLGPQIQAIMTLGEWHVDRLRQQLRLPPHFPIRVVTEGVEIPRETYTQAEARAKIGLQEYKGKVILFFGTIRRDKGIDTLFEAISKVCRKDFILLMAGAPVHFTSDELNSMIARCGIQDRVLTRFDYIAEGEMSLYFYAADAVILPYGKIYTGGSGPLRKASAHGKAMIVSNVSEMGRLAESRKIGLVAQAEDSTDLASKIEEFLNLPQHEQLQLAANSLAMAQECSWGNMARSFEVLYAELLLDRRQSKAVLLSSEQQ